MSDIAPEHLSWLRQRADARRKKWKSHAEKEKNVRRLPDIPMNFQVMDVQALVKAQEGINYHFVKRRDAGKSIDFVYGLLKEVEAELNRRKIRW